jgi:Fe2+ or Zn2+ uptake regulation protein
MNVSKSIRINGYNERMINVLKNHPNETITASAIIKEMACGIQTAAAYTTINRLVSHGIVIKSKAEKVNVYTLSADADNIIHTFRTQFDEQKAQTKARHEAIKAEEKALRLQLKADKKLAKELQAKEDRELRLKLRAEEKAAREASKPIKMPKAPKAPMAAAAKKVVGTVEKNGSAKKNVKA